MDELIQWFGEQLDEDERITRAVRVPPDWHQGPGDDPEWADAEMVCMWPPEFHTPYERDRHWRGLSVEGAELAEHIAAHDPRRVLREIDAKRQTVAQCRAAEECMDQAMRDNDMPSYQAARAEAKALHAVIRRDAAVYADRPGYKEAWCPGISAG
ncbi:DUF6221 family protein [Streptomyces decoyicus]|uniref:DUF6221 family protein n=1 Tax=Streptomyces decoyicus TaxID=249567 RepID=UPI0033AE9B1C